MSDERVFAADVPANERARIAEPVAATNRALWFAVGAPPIAWSIDLLASIAIHQDYCGALVSRSLVPWGGIKVMLITLGVLLGAVAVWAFILGQGASAAMGRDTGDGDTDLDRRAFMARVATLAGGIFTLAIALTTLASIILPVAACGQ